GKAGLHGLDARIPFLEPVEDLPGRLSLYIKVSTCEAEEPHQQGRHVSYASFHMDSSTLMNRCEARACQRKPRARGAGNGGPGTPHPAKVYVGKDINRVKLRECQSTGVPRPDQRRSGVLSSFLVGSLGRLSRLRIL